LSNQQVNAGTWSFPHSVIFMLDFRNVPTVGYVLFLIFFKTTYYKVTRGCCEREKHDVAVSQIATASPFQESSSQWQIT
jgi:hypothetical protein